MQKKWLAKNDHQLDAAAIDQLLHLGKSPPDELLLRRYFRACEGEVLESPLPAAERRWISVNLDDHPAWQQKWVELEKELGRSVDWRAQALFPQAQVPSKSVFKPRLLTMRLPQWQPQSAFRFAMAALAFIVLYGTLWLAGRLGLPETYTLASVDAYEDILRVESRGERTGVNEFTAGVSALLSSPRGWLGLFPHYNQTKVDEAIGHFHRAFQAAEDPFHKAEIAFFLAKAFLMKEDVSNAKDWLEQVLAQNVADYRDDATHLLKKLTSQME